MPLHAEAAPHTQQDVLLVMVPGMGMRAADFHTRGLIEATQRRRWPLTITTVDPKPEAYLDGSVEVQLLTQITQAQRRAGTSRVWLAGISLGCQAILRCVRAQPGVAEGLMLLTPYLASTGLIAEVERSGGLRTWATANHYRTEPDRVFLNWLTTANLPRMLIGHALDDRFATTSQILAALLPAGRVIQVAGAHDWTSWNQLWRLMLDQNPFAQAEASTS